MKDAIEKLAGAINASGYDTAKAALREFADAIKAEVRAEHHCPCEVRYGGDNLTRNGPKWPTT